MIKKNQALVERRRKHRSVATILLISLALALANTLAMVQAAQKTYFFTATISPTEANVNQLVTYSVTITNTGTSTLGSTSTTIPTGFTIVSTVTILNPLSWNSTLSNGAINLTGLPGGGLIQQGENVTYTFDAIAPALSGVYNWTTEAYANMEGTGTLLTLQTEQPTVAIISPPYIAPTISASSSPINQNQVSLLSQLTSPSGGTLPYSYQWLAAVNGGMFSPIAGANGQEYIFGPTTSSATGTWSFELSVTDSSSVPLTVTSNIVNVVVNSELVAPVLTATPNVVTQDQPSSLTSSTVTTGTSPYTYQWFQQTPGGDYTTVGGNSPNYFFSGTSITGTWKFLLQVTDAAGAKVNSTSIDITVNWTPIFTITVTQASHGTITPGTSSVTLGGSQSFTISPEIGYQISDVIVDGIQIGATTSYSFSNIAADHQITATFTPIEYTLTVSVVGSGTVTQNPTQVTYHYGDLVQLTANPTSGWRFSVWSGDLSGSTNPSSITIYGNTVITATFLNNQFAISAVAGAGGSISPSGITIVDYMGSQPFSITPNSGYHIVDVFVNSTSVGPVSSYMISGVTGDTTITASFAPNTLTITASAGPNGSIDPSGMVIVTYGNNQGFAISPATGYRIADILVDGVSVGPVTSYSFTNVIANHNIVANFAVNSVNSYLIEVMSPRGMPTPSGQANAGASFTASITSPEGDASHRWICTGYSVDGGSPVSGTSYTFANVQATHTITFNWQEQYYLAVISLEGSTTGAEWYNTGTTATISVSSSTITIDDKTQQIFTGWTGDLVTTSTSNTLTIDGAKTVTANWKTQFKVAFVLEGISSDASGMIVTILGIPRTYEELQNGTWVDAGDILTFSYAETVDSRETGKQFTLVSTNSTSPLRIDEPMTIQARYEFQTSAASLNLMTTAMIAILATVPPSVAIPLVALRRRGKKRITPIRSEGGSISPGNVQTIGRGEDSTIFIIAPQVGYRVADVVIDKAIHVGPVRTYKFYRVKENHSIAAIFQKC